jgi:hypothetical protein
MGAVIQENTVPLPGISRHSMSFMRPVKMLVGRGKCWYFFVALQYWITTFFCFVPSQKGWANP